VYLYRAPKHVLTPGLENVPELQPKMNIYDTEIFIFNEVILCHLFLEREYDLVGHMIHCVVCTVYIHGCHVTAYNTFHTGIPDHSKYSTHLYVYTKCPNTVKRNIFPNFENTKLQEYMVLGELVCFLMSFREGGGPFCM